MRFLGSGCAKWDPAWLKDNPFVRRQASVLVDDRVLIDFTACGFDMLPEGCCPEALFLTHSHGDHYNPDAIVRVGVKSVYLTHLGGKYRRLPAEQVDAELPPGIRAASDGQVVTFK